MANSLNTNPIVISQTQTAYKPAVLTSQGSFITLRIIKVYWENPTNIGDTFVIQDPASGHTWLTGRCEVANQSQIFDFTAKPLLWKDFEVLTLASGTLYIYLD